MLLTVLDAAIRFLHQSPDTQILDIRLSYLEWVASASWAHLRGGSHVRNAGALHALQQGCIAVAAAADARRAHPGPALSGTQTPTQRRSTASKND